MKNEVHHNNQGTNKKTVNIIQTQVIQMTIPKGIGQHNTRKNKKTKMKVMRIRYIKITTIKRLYIIKTAIRLK